MLDNVVDSSKMPTEIGYEPSPLLAGGKILSGTVFPLPKYNQVLGKPLVW